MRKRIVFQCMLPVLILVSACSNEEYIGTPPPPNSDSFITFRLQGKGQPASYAIASANENTVNFLDIYMFSDHSAESRPNLLQKVFRVGSEALNQQNTDLEATVNVTGRTGKYIFYFVANGNNASSLADINIGTTTEDDFRERLTDIQEGFIALPLLMTARKEIADVEAPTDAERQVTLLRRVARFDVDNDASVTHLTIHKILVDNVNQQSYIFGDATGVPVQTLATGKHPVVENNKPANFNTNTPAEGIFYLYPTQFGTDKTFITFEGEFMGERRIYVLKSNTTIEANKRYVLKVKAVNKNTLDFAMEVEAWLDGGSHTAEPITNDMEIETTQLTGGVGTQRTDNTFDTSDAIADGVLTIPVKTYHKEGARVEITYLYGTGNTAPLITVNNPEPVLTYSAGYIREFKINIPVRKAPLHARIEVINNWNAEDKETFYVNCIPNYDTTAEKPILFGNIYWAPVNVGATEIGTTVATKHHGLFYQWGRNTGFAYGGDKGNPSDVYATMGPVKLNTAVMGSAKGLFVKGMATPFDWLTPQDSTLWSGKNQQGPCPDGWRIPTKAELELITVAFGSSYTTNGGAVTFNATEKRIKVRGDNEGDVLYLPVAGYRYYGTGSSGNQGTGGHYWSSEPDGLSATRLCFHSSNLYLNASSRAYGCSIRCVQK